MAVTTSPLRDSDRRIGVLQLFAGRDRKQDTTVEPGKQIDGIDQDEVVEGGGVGDDEHWLNSHAVAASRSTCSLVRW